MSSSPRQPEDSPREPTFAFRTVVVVGALLFCGLMARAAARSGISRLFSEYGANTAQLAPADLAVRLTPADPEAHFARGAALAGAGAIDAARAADEEAARLRPADYVIWLELGKVREQAGDTAGALAAFDEAIRLAPHYAEPRWQLGNTLLRAGQTAEAFAALRQAAGSDPALYPSLLDLAWYASARAPQRLVEIVKPTAPAEHTSVARFLAGRGATVEAVEQFRAAGQATSEADRREMTKALLAARSFAEAYVVWAEGHPEEGRAPGEIADGGFEQTLRRDDPGFVWQFASDAGDAFKLSLDPVAPRAGGRSLRLDFNGNSAPGTELIAQLVLAAPGAHYRLSFSARTEELVTGGPLLLSVLSAGAKADAPLAQSAPLPAGTSAWRDFTVEFTTPADARALRVVVSRQACASGGVCPVFGRAWLDEFKLERL